MEPAGIYHVTNRGGASWYDFAREIYRIAGKSTTVLPVPSTRFPRKAKRPARAVLLNTQLPPLRPWQEALADFLRCQSGGNCGSPRTAEVPART
jgi:dTDP-4-dehydrorhamnose reductase